MFYLRNLKLRKLEANQFEADLRFKLCVYEPPKSVLLCVSQSILYTQLLRANLLRPGPRPSYLTIILESYVMDKALLEVSCHSSGT